MHGSNYNNSKEYSATFNLLTETFLRNFYNHEIKS